MNKIRRSSLHFLAVLTGVFGLCHCGPDVDALCEGRKSCIGGNDKDLEVCVLEYDALSDYADAIGCSEEFDIYFSCFEENTACRSEDAGGQCMTDADCPNADSDESFACVSGACKRSFYGLPNDNNGQDGPCEAEQNAFNRCF